MENNLIDKNEKWYQKLTYNDAKTILQEKLMNIKRSYIAVGYFLKYIRDNELYLEDGYKTIWEFAKDNFGITRSTCSRYMSMNDKFSKNGNTPILADEYEGFGKSQLQEMLYLDDKKMKEATSDMTVKEIRKLREPEKKLIKPDQEQMEYLNTFARRFIACARDWLLQDFQNRVTNVDKSPDEIKKHLGIGRRTWHFSTDNGVAHINLFDDYVQLWEEGNACLGDFDWFYFASALQRMWNVVAMENAQKERDTECATSHKTEMCIHRPEFACTLPEASKFTVGDGIDCSKKCCWDCPKRMGCGYRCNSAAGHPIEEKQIPGQMNVEDYPELLPEKKNSDINDVNNDINNDVNNLVDEQLEVVMDADETVINAEYCEVNEEKLSRPDAMLTCLVEACMAKFDFDTGFEETEDIEEFHDWVYDELLGMIIRFWFEGKEYKVEFLEDIGVTNADTDEEIYQRYVWQEFFEKLSRVGGIGEKYVAENAESCCQEIADLDELAFSEIAIRDYLEDEEKTLAEYIQCDQREKGFPQRILQKQQMLVKALRLFLENEAAQDEYEGDESERIEQIQPDLPVMKNNDQRKNFLKNYQIWPVWFTVPDASEVYYRFNLPDGSSIAICEYHMWLGWKERYNENPDSIGTREYLLMPGYKYLQDCHTNSTALVEHLKNIQKREKEGGKQC